MKWCGDHKDKEVITLMLFKCFTCLRQTLRLLYKVHEVCRLREIRYNTVIKYKTDTEHEGWRLKNSKGLSVLN